MNLEIIKTQEYTPVVFGGWISGYGIVRSLADEGIFSVVVDTKKTIANYSKFAYSLISTDPYEDENKCVEFLIDFAKNNLKNKGVIFISNDFWLRFLPKHEDKLNKYYIFTNSSWDIIDLCSDKTKLYQFANKYQIPYPKTTFLTNIYDYENYKNELIYPLVLKPSVTLGFQEKLKMQKILTINNQDEMEKIVKKIIDVKLDDIEIVLQEKIEGDVSKTLYTITTYSNKDGDVIAYSTGHKIRQAPPDAGTIVSGKVKPEPKLYELIKPIIKEINTAIL